MSMFDLKWWDRVKNVGFEVRDYMRYMDDGRMEARWEGDELLLMSEWEDVGLSPREITRRIVGVQCTVQCCAVTSGVKCCVVPRCSVHTFNFY